MHISLLMLCFNNRHLEMLQKFSLSFLMFYIRSLFQLFKPNLNYLSQFLLFSLCFIACLSSHQVDILYRLSKD